MQYGRQHEMRQPLEIKDTQTNEPEWLLGEIVCCLVVLSLNQIDSVHIW